MTYQARSFNLSGMQLFTKILLPAALPTIFVGVRLGLIFTLINDLAERYDLPGTYAAIFFVILVSVCFFVTIERVERWLRPVA